LRYKVHVSNVPTPLAPQAMHTVFSTVAKQYANDFQNTGTVTCDNVAMVTPTDSDTADVNIVDPMLTLDKTASKTQGVIGVDPLQAIAGVDIFYAFKATNTGDVPLNNCQVSDPNLGGNVGAPFNLPNNGDMATVFSVAAKQYADDFQNTGTVTCDNVAMVTPTDSDTADVDIVDPMLTLDKTASLTQGVIGVDPLQAPAGTDIFYAFKSTNTGDVPLNNCQVSDPNLGGNVGAPFNLPNNGDMNTVFSVAAKQYADDFQNLGTVTCDNVAMETPVAQDTADVVIPAMPGVKLMKLADPTIIEAGETVTYTFDATNTGDVALSGCNINDDKLGLIAADFTIPVGESKAFQASTDIFVKTKNTATVICLTGVEPPMVSDTAMATVIIIFVGGEFLPIDSTALFVSGIQTSAVWILPAVAGLVGTGYYLIRFRAKE